jgi:NAD(P) transhydrogenase
MKRYDLVVIGSGPAGHHAAIQGAKLGGSVVVVEAQPRVGGAGLNTGTIPSKTLREGVLALRRTGTRESSLPGAPGRWDEALRALQVRCRHVVDQEVQVYRAQFARNRVEVLTGLASFVTPHRIRIEGPHHETEVEADTIVIAAGSVPARSERVPIQPPAILDTDSIFSLTELPRSMIIAGGGVVGVEFACMFAALGIGVTVVDLRPRLLEFVDAEIVEALCYQMRDAGITLRLGEELECVTRVPGAGVEAVLKSRKQVFAETLLYAVGRQGNTAGLNLGAAGLEADGRGRIPVDARYRTRVPHIYAVGDVIGFPGLASVSMAQGRLAACDALHHPAAAQRRLFPYGIYTIPEISFVGQTEAELTAAGIPYEVGIARYREIARGQIMGDISGRLKLLFHRESGQLLGVHIIGEGASELVHIGQAVLTFGGTIDYFLENVFNYPTLAECYQVAALAVVNRLTRPRARLDRSPGAPDDHEPALVVPEADTACV